MRTIVLLAVLLSGFAAWADEIRLKDGEILYGTVERMDGALRVAQGERVRTVHEADVAEVLAGGAPERLEEPAAGTWRSWRQGSGLPYDLASRWGAPRRTARSAGGGTAATEAAVERACAWLAAHPDEDGKLDADGFMKHDPDGAKTDGAGGGHHGERVPCGYDGVTTAVALMVWSAAGSTPVSGPYRANVAKALAYCKAIVARGPGGAYGLWNFGFCTQAIADVYLLRPDPDLVLLIRGAVRQILDLQQADGGWSYYLQIGDVPTTGVAASALGLAARAGFAVPQTEAAAALQFLDARVEGNGRSEYHEGAERKGYTPTRANAAANLAVQALFGRLGNAPQLAKQVAAIQEKPVWKIEFKEVKTKDGRTVRAQLGNLYPYQWYYTTVALFERGGSTWATWFSGLKTALLNGQRKDGSFAGSWDALGNYSDSAGRVFVTGLCALMLQAPYRYPRLR